MSSNAGQKRAREQKFLWHERLPVGHMAVIAGQPGMGKSTLGYRIAADCGVPTLFITTEEVSDTVWLPRLIAAGANLDLCWHHPEVMFTRSQIHLDYLRDLIVRYGIKLIVVDPIQNHLGASISHDVAVRTLIKPYLELCQEHGVALLLEAHVLRDISPSSDPLTAIPAGLRGEAKAVYLFGKDPTLGADPDLRVLATAKFNFNKWPVSRRFEFDTNDVSVIRASGKGRVKRDYAMWVDRGEVKISAKMLLVTLSPETKERKADRAAWELMNFLRDGQKTVASVRRMVLDLDPPVVWRTVQRVAKELGIEATDDPKDARKKWWALPDEILGTLEEADSPEDVEITEVDAIDDTFPEDWAGEDA